MLVNEHLPLLRTLVRANAWQSLDSLFGIYDIDVPEASGAAFQSNLEFSPLMPTVCGGYASPKTFPADIRVLKEDVRIVRTEVTYCLTTKWKAANMDSTSSANCCELQEQRR